MATPPYAKVLVSVNGAAAVSGGVTVTAGQTIQLSGESTVGWRSQRWEITDAPPGFTLPSGWVAAGDGTFYSVSVTPPAFTMPTLSSTTWGKYAIRLRVNGNPLLVRPDGTRNPAYRTNLTDESTMLSMLSAAGLEGIALGETTQFDPVKGWIGGVQRNFRNLPTGGGGGAGIPNNAVTTYSAVADGTTDNTTPITAATTALGTARRLYLPEGTYFVNNNLTIASPIEFAPGAIISVAAGKTVTYNGSITAGDYQKIFAGAGLHRLNANTRLSVCWWGADWTNTNDSAAAIQSALDAGLAVRRVLDPAVPSTTAPYPAVVFLPSGLYYISKTVVIAGTSLRFVGNGPIASNLTVRGGQYPAIMASREIGSLPVVANLTGSSVGNAYNMDFDNHLTLAAGSTIETYAATPAYTYLIPSHETSSLSHALSLKNLTSVCVRFFLKLAALPSDGQFRSITGNGGALADTGDVSNVKSGWNIQLTPTGKLTVAFNPSAGGAMIHDDATVLTPGTTYFVEFNWKGSTGRTNFHVVPMNSDGSMGTPSSYGITGPTGNLLTDVYSMTVIGVAQSSFPNGGGHGIDAIGKISEWEVRSDNGHGDTVTGVTLANAVFDGSTLCGTHFELAGPNGELVKFYGPNGSVGYSPVRLGNLEVASRYGGGIQVMDLGTDCGIYFQLCTNSSVDNVWVNGGMYGVFFDNNCYSSHISKIRVHTTQLMGIFLSNGGIVSVSDCEVFCSGFAIGAVGAGCNWSNIYAQSPYVGIHADAQASFAPVNLTNVYTTDEAFSTSKAKVVVGGKILLSCTNCVFENVNDHGYPYQGVYDPSVTYAAGQSVRARANDTTVYRALVTCTGYAPSDTSKWAPIVNDMFRITSPEARIKLECCNVSPGQTVGSVFNFQLQGSVADGAVSADTYLTSQGFTIPITNSTNPKAVGQNNGGGLAGVRGISNGKTAAQNLWGVVTIYGTGSGTTVTATATFDVTEPDTDYMVVSPNNGKHAGTPAAGSLTYPYWSNKTTAGYDITILNPGAGNSVDVSWMVGRWAKATPPVLTSISPTNGLPTGTTAVTATGTGFVDGAVAIVNGTAIATTFTSSTSLSFTVPTSSTSGDVVITIRNPDGRQSTFASFHYNGVPIVSSTSPTTLTTAGGSIAVTGQAFLAGMTATYNGASATVSAITSTTCNVAIPATTPQGTYNLVLTTTAGAGPAYAFPVTDPVGNGTAYGESGAKRWIKSDLGVTTSGSNISSIVDQSGGGNTYVGGNGTGVGAPILTSSGAGINGKPVFAADKASTQYLKGPTMVGSGMTAFHAFYLIAPTVDGTAQSMIGNSADNAIDFFPYTSGVGYVGAGTTLRKGPTTSSITSAAQLLEIVSTSTKYEVRVNGTVVFNTSSNTVGFHAGGDFLFGCNDVNSGTLPNYYGTGKIGEYLVFDHEVTGTALTNVRAGFTTRWAVP